MLQYKEFAYIYDKLMREDVNYPAWCDYIENLFDRHGAAPDTICELACGTGSMTAQLERRGYDMTGVDISEDMLEVAWTKLKDPRLIHSDMAKLVPYRRFDAFLCMIDGINYVIAPAQIQNTFDMVRTYLNDGGVFIFDVSTRYKLENIIGNNTFIHSEYDVFYSWQNRYIERLDLSDMYLNFFVRDKGERYRRFEERHLQRGWSEKQLRAMLCRAGFTDITVYDELTFDPPKTDSSRIVFVCK
ncbi:MAG: class I SAM-dependent DNA methyltransferase [Candidatus Ornithomonoglobus sp.]